MVVEISLTKNLKRKKKEKIQGRTNRRRSIFYPTIQLVVANLYTKFEVSILDGCGDIFDEKSGKKKKEQIQGRTNRRRPIFYPTIQHVIVNLYTKFEVSIFKSCGDTFDGKKEKGTSTRKNKQENALFPLNSCGDIFDKNLERKKKEEKNK